MTLTITATTPPQTRERGLHPAPSRSKSALQLVALIALTSLITGLIIAIAFVGALDQLTTASR